MSALRLRRLLTLPSHLRVSTYTRTLAPSTTVSHLRAFSSGKPHRNGATQAESSPSSVNQEEVSHFNALASSWWDPHGSSRLLHLMNPLRHDFIRRCQRMEQPTEEQGKLRYLDIGCGGGIFAESAARMSHTASVTAIDPTPEVIAVARKHQRLDPLLLEPGRLNYQQTSIENLPASAGYDIITVFEVLEHIRSPASFLELCLPHLKPGGWIIGSTIARTNLSWFTTKLVAEDLLRIVPRGTHEWGQYIMPNELFQWARVKEEFDIGHGMGWEVMGVVYVPGLGWKEVNGSEEWGNYFFGMRKRVD